jgi:hypothetical protein
MKSGNLNFLEPSGPLEACNGIALLYLYTPATLEVMKIKDYNRNIVIMHLRIFKYISHALLLH